MHSFFYKSYLGLSSGQEIHLVKSFESNIVLEGHLIHFLEILSKWGSLFGQFKH